MVYLTHSAPVGFFQIGTSAYNWYMAASGS